ncbi:MAG TPA: penicillin-binding protein 2, partial [Chlorobaculum parvum]|nr:penicillin-binding protein 2 [Chlorobaculum parvum]
AVLVENAGYGGSISAPIARQMIDYYINGPKKPKEEASKTKADNNDHAASDSLKTRKPVKATTNAPHDSTGVEGQTGLGE